MRIFRFMSINEFRNFLNGESIEGRFVKGKACFLEENITARKKEESVKDLTDITSLNFKSTNFEEQMKELSELITPTFTNGNFEGELKDLEYLNLADFMKKVRDGSSAEVLVEFETTEKFEQEYEKVIMAYKNYLIQEIQANGYSNNTLRCVSYKIDLVNGFKDGIGIDTIEEKKFKGVERTLADLQKVEQEKTATSNTRYRHSPSVFLSKDKKLSLLESGIEATEIGTRTGMMNDQIIAIKRNEQQRIELENNLDENDDNKSR